MLSSLNCACANDPVDDFWKIIMLDDDDDDDIDIDNEHLQRRRGWFSLKDRSKLNIDEDCNDYHDDDDLDYDDDTTVSNHHTFHYLDTKGVEESLGQAIGAVLTSKHSTETEKVIPRARWWPSKHHRKRKSELFHPECATNKTNRDLEGGEHSPFVLFRKSTASRPSTH